MFKKIILSFASAALITSPLVAHKLIDPGPREKIARGVFSAVPTSTWNRLQQKEGKFQEVWTIDGDDLNRIIFFGGVPIGEPLLKETHKKRDPLPKVKENMLLPDIPILLERTYRTKYGTAIMEIGQQKPAELAGLPAIFFEYRYVDGEYEVEKNGEAYAAMHEGKLYLIAFEAPTLHFFERDIHLFRELVGTVSIRD
ncbi:hypothetical protein [uncultured Parasphingorhabdus sp.]|uniref:hypothetical protein n=1 Tax=uncultured Parasphingorhabdus sp. TaxID=2709694 RepID=UPI002AA65EEA|nr:hypothetical protein [uncultured Parasphingorhabdus sp.]